MQIGAYVRVSSQGQDDGSQRDAIRRAASARGDEVAVWFAEKASATNNDRAALGELRTAARAGELRRLYVFRVDRLTRTGILDTFRLVEELRRHGCELVTVADGFDLQGPGAEITLAVFAWAAKMERAALAERLAASRARAKAAGKSWGRPPTHDDDLAKKAVEMRVNEKKSIRKISVALKVPRSTVGRWVRGCQRSA